MKLLLTSNGLANRSITEALLALTETPANKTNIAFIPTAMNVDSGSKDWFIDDLYNIKKEGFQSVDVVDISAVPKEVWLPRLEEAQVIFVGGGNTYHLMRWMKESGLSTILPELLKTRVYAGISAGSMITNPSLALSSSDRQIYNEDSPSEENMKALGLVNFFIRPHFNSPHFPLASKAHLETIAENIPEIIYALDDNSAVVYSDGALHVVSEGDYLILNNR